MVGFYPIICPLYYTNIINFKTYKFLLLIGYAPTNL